MTRRPAAVAALLALLAALLLPVAGAAPASAAGEDPTATALNGTVSPGTALPGTLVHIDSSGWPALTQVQAVVCGDLAIGGSNTCDQTAGQLGAADAGGVLSLDVVVGDPPAPCPCVIRVASYSGPVLSLDIPFVVEGHETGTPPTPTAPEADVQVTDVRLEGSGGVAALFGAAPSRRLVVTLTNQGTAAAVNPTVRVGVGKSDKTEPTSLTVTELTLDPLQSAQVAVDVRLPFAAFGTYRIAVASGEDGAIARTSWSAYPWGLVGLNVLGLLLIGWGLRRRYLAKSRAAAAAARHRMVERPYPLPDVVYVEELGGFLVSPRAAGRSRLLGRVTGRLESQDLAALLGVVPAGEPGPTGVVPAAAVADEGGDAVVDLAAADRWLARRAHRSHGQQAAEPEAEEAAPDAVVDLAAVDRWLERRHGGTHVG